MFGHLEKVYILYILEECIYSSFITSYKYMLNGVNTKLKKQVHNLLINNQQLSCKKQKILGFIESHPPYLRFLL